jgi:hypothetical protein
LSFAHSFLLFNFGRLGQVVIIVKNKTLAQNGVLIALFHFVCVNFAVFVGMTIIFMRVIFYIMQPAVRSNLRRG